MGAGKWRKEYNQYFRGREVYIIPDNDQAGREHGESAAKHLHGTASLVKVVELPNLPAKGDVSDFLAAGGTKEQLLNLALEAVPFQGDAWKEPKTKHKPGPGEQAWEKPIPLSELPPVLPFPLDVFPYYAREFARQGAVALGCPPDYLPFLCLPWGSTHFNVFSRPL
jgi:hypothetical protein